MHQTTNTNTDTETHKQTAPDKDKDKDKDTDTDTISCAHFITDTHLCGLGHSRENLEGPKKNVHPAASDRASREHRAGAIHSIGLSLSSARRF